VNTERDDRRPAVREHDDHVGQWRERLEQQGPSEGTALTRDQQGERNEPGDDVADTLDLQVGGGLPVRPGRHPETGGGAGGVQQEPAADNDDADPEQGGQNSGGALGGHGSPSSIVRQSSSARTSGNASISSLVQLAVLGFDHVSHWPPGT
jgi:hypothetical protein